MLLSSYFILNKYGSDLPDVYSCETYYFKLQLQELTRLRNIPSIRTSTASPMYHHDRRCYRRSPFRTSSHQRFRQIPTFLSLPVSSGTSAFKSHITRKICFPGDFEEIYGTETDPGEPQSGKWDAILTCFFIDTVSSRYWLLMQIFSDVSVA